MHALGSWYERYRSGTGARQSDRSGLWIKTRSALRLYFARSAPRSLHAPLRSHALPVIHYSIAKASNLSYKPLKLPQRKHKYADRVSCTGAPKYFFIVDSSGVKLVLFSIFVTHSAINANNFKTTCPKKIEIV